MPHTSLRRARFTRHSPELLTDVRRGYGWYPYCACGWEGAPVRDADAARRACFDHWYETHRRHPPEPS